MNDEKMIEDTEAELLPGEISSATIDAIAGGYCGDPFAVLGPHPVPSRDAWTVRAFLPQAETANVLLPTAPQGRCFRGHPAGMPIPIPV
jgi:1,4-alpha-glucan branching enzyme